MELASVRQVAQQALDGRVRSLLIWSLALAALTSLQLAAFPAIRSASAGMTELLRSYPPALKETFGLDTFLSGSGFLHAEVFTLVGPLLLSAIAISGGAGGTAQEEETGTADLLFTTPATRTQVLLGKVVAMVGGVLVPALVLLVTIRVVGDVVHLDVALSRVAAAVTMSFLLATVFGGVAVLVGAATGRRGPAVGAAVAVTVLAFVGNVLGGLAHWLSPWKTVSPFQWAVGTRPVISGMDWTAALQLVALALVLVVGAALVLRRRDLRSR